MDWIGANISTPAHVSKDDTSGVATIAKNRLNILVLTSHLLKSNVVSHDLELFLLMWRIRLCAPLN